jgi:hypothetical protein
VLDAEISRRAHVEIRNAPHVFLCTGRWCALYQNMARLTRRFTSSASSRTVAAVRGRQVERLPLQRTSAPYALSIDKDPEGPITCHMHLIWTVMVSLDVDGTWTAWLAPRYTTHARVRRGNRDRERAPVIARRNVGPYHVVQSRSTLNIRPSAHLVRDSLRALLRLGPAACMLVLGVRRSRSGRPG